MYVQPGLPPLPPILLEGDPEPVFPMTGPGRRFLVPPEPTRPAPLSDEEAMVWELDYGQGRLWLTARDPHTLHATWDLTAAQQAAAGERLAVRVYRGREVSARFREVLPGRHVRSVFVPAESPGEWFMAEIGFTDARGLWQMLARSEPVRTPPLATREAEEPQFVLITLPPPEPPAAASEAAPAQPLSAAPVPAARETTPAPTYPEATAAGPEFVPVISSTVPTPATVPAAICAAPPAQTVEGTSAPGTPVPIQAPTAQRGGPAPAGPPIQTRPAALAIKLEARPSAPPSPVRRWIPAPAPPWSITREKAMTRMIEFQRAALPGSPVWGPTVAAAPAAPGAPTPAVEVPIGETAPLSAAAPAPSSAEWSPSEHQAVRPTFWFNINAELIVYGATEPDARVTVDGLPVALRPDGSFTLRFALPDGEYALRAEAVSADGAETRRARLEFLRRTAYRGEVGQHPADPSLPRPVPREGAS